MKKYWIVLLIFLAVTKNIYSQHTLEIEIKGFRSDTGAVMLQLLDGSKNMIRQDKGIIIDGNTLIIFNNLEPGKYAVRYYHDENLSENMETNSIGIPREGYGFSNDAYGFFGPRPFEDWLFELKENKRISLKIKYH